MLKSPAAETASSKWTTRFGLPLRRRMARWLTPKVALTIIGLFFFAAIFAPWITPYDPVDNSIVDALQPPFWVEGGSTAHLLGTDEFGRDVFTRLIYGGRITFSVAFLALGISLTIGTIIGLVAGFSGGWVDTALMRLVDIGLAVPQLLVALVVSIVLGPSFRNTILILGLLFWTQIARLVRGEALAVQNREFVRYSNAIGVPRALILLKHIFPNVLPTLMVATTLEIGSVVLTEASLSFLGAGLPPPQPSWGVMIADGRGLIATGWWIVLFPGIALTLMVLSFNSLGDWLRDRLDPKTKAARK